MKGILFDLDGVFYVGDQAVPGGGEVIRWVSEQGIPHLFVTNTTSRPRDAVVEKLDDLGIRIPAQRIFTPAVAAVEWLPEHVSGPLALFLPDATRAEFSAFEELDEAAEVGAAAVLVGDLGRAWDFATLNRAFRLLIAEPRPPLIAMGMTRYWRTPEGLQLDAGPFVRALEYASGIDAVVMGKPADGFFRAAAAALDLGPGDLVMIGDDIRGDVEGAQKSGCKGILVRTGKFTPADLALGIQPSAVLESVADLPTWWKKEST